MALIVFNSAGFSSVLSEAAVIALTLIPSLRSNSGCSDCVWDSTTGSRVDLIADEPRRFGNVAVRVASQLDGLYGHSSAVRCVNWSGRKALPMPLQCTKPQVLRIFIGVSPSITIIKTEQVSGTANVRMAACGVCTYIAVQSMDDSICDTSPPDECWDCHRPTRIQNAAATRGNRL